jgi:hypothetical protein
MFRRQNIRDFSLNRRQDGLSALDRLRELSLWRLAFAILTLARTFPLSRFTFFLHWIGLALVQRAINLRQMMWYAVDPIDPTSF